MESLQSTSGINKSWQVFQRRWLPGTIAFITIFSLGSIASLIKKPIYEATAELKFKKNDASSSLTEVSRELGTLSPLAEKSNPLSTEAQVISSVPLIQKTIEMLKLKNSEGEALQVEEFRQNLLVKEITGTDLLSVAYRDENAEKAAEVVNGLIANYLDNNVSVNRAEAVAAREFLEKQLPEAEKTLIQSESSIRKVQEENNIISFEQEASATVNNLKNVEQRLIEANSQIANTRSQSDYLKKQLGLNPEQALAATAVSQSPEIQEIVKQIQELESKLAVEKTRFTDRNPEVQALQAKINSLEALIQKQVGSVGGVEAQKVFGNHKFGSTQQQLTTDLIKLEATNIGFAKQVAYLNRIEQEQRTKARRLPELQQKLRQLERQLSVSRSTYELLLQQLKTIQLAENQNIGNVRVLSYALVPEKPVSSLAIAILASGSLALLTAAGLVYLLEITDNSIKTVEEAKKLFGYTWLGVIPNIDRSKLLELPESKDPLVPQLIVRDRPSSSISESYRMLQSNLKFLTSDKQLKTIVVTSSVTQEGKSTVAANLAAAMAQVGNRVLLLDADLHHPMQHRIWDTYNERGLSHVIAEQIDPRLAIEEVMLNLDVLTSGVVAPSPATLLDSQRMRMLMDYWAERYDFVIVDTPSLDLAADAPILGRMADGVLLVVKPGCVERSQANFAKEILEQSGQNVLGIVVNGVNSKTEPYNYYYHSLEDPQENRDGSTKLLGQSREELWETISRLAKESKKSKFDVNIDLKQLNNVPLEELEATIVYLQQDLEDLTRLVKEQEEELFLQRQKVKKFQRKVNLATDEARLNLEEQLSQEQERKNMLDETLVGQRRNLDKRKKILNKYRQVLETKQS
jgi:capsular exopolysaccharide synthesis family protein